MKLKILKPGKWGINQPGPEVIVLSEEKLGEVIEHKTIDMKTALEMEETGYIEIIEDDDTVEESTDPLDSLDEEEDGSDTGEETGDDDAPAIAIILQEICESAGGNKNKQKDALETWAKVNLDGFDLNKKRSLEVCIEVLIAKHNELNG